MSVAGVSASNMPACLCLQGIQRQVFRLKKKKILPVPTVTALCPEHTLPSIIDSPCSFPGVSCSVSLGEGGAAASHYSVQNEELMPAASLGRACMLADF